MVSYCYFYLDTVNPRFSGPGLYSETPHIRTPFQIPLKFTFIILKNLPFLFGLG